MAEWRTPVFDRTMDDAKSLDRTSAVYQKGALNADDLNRIEDNFKYVMAKLRSDAIFIPHRLRSFTETVLEYVGKENCVLPEGYTQVEYIQSSGTQYINTRLKPTSKYRVVMDFQLTSVSGWACLFGSSDTVGNVNSYALWYTGTAFAYYFGTNSSTTFPTTIDSFGECHFESSGNTATIDGNTVTVTDSTFSGSQPLYLFAVNYGGTAQHFASGKWKPCKIYNENGVLVRDYIPCINPSGMVSMYDLVNAEFYENLGTGAFTAGIEIEPETTYEPIESETTYTDWQEHNLPWLSEINRIRANHNALVRLFLVGLGFSEQAESNYLDYGEVNDWERIVFAGKTMFENMEKEYRYCGMEHSGGDRLL